MTLTTGTSTGTGADLDALLRRALRIRERIVDICGNPEGGHLGGSMSLVEVLTALYFDVMRIDPTYPDDPDRDVFLLSKGHAAIGLYATLAERGFFAPEELADYAKPGSRFMGHPVRSVPGVEMPTGSLGHGLALAIGFAYAARRTGSPRRAFVAIGDGEMQEGSVWEGAMGAAGLGLDNLVAVIDRNGLQLTGETEEICPLEPVGDRWRSFGWAVREVPGQDLAAVREALLATPWAPGQPNALIMRTTKGAGVPFVAGTPKSHYVNFSERQLARAHSALRREAERQGVAGD
ncbi:MAG TPA: transketolase [Micromonosporaceae bacterium]|nr:transketolase [Micromonosporaceae bacterium]